MLTVFGLENSIKGPTDAWWFFFPFAVMVLRTFHQFWQTKNLHLKKLNFLKKIVKFKQNVELKWPANIYCSPKLLIQYSTFLVCGGSHLQHYKSCKSKTLRRWRPGLIKPFCTFSHRKSSLFRKKFSRPQTNFHSGKKAVSVVLITNE